MSKGLIATPRWWLIPLSQGRPYLACQRPPKPDLGRRSGPLGAVLAHPGGGLSPTWRTSERRGALPGIGAADNVPIALGFMVRCQAEYRFERDVPIEAAIVAEDEFIEIRVDVPAAQSVVRAQTPPLHQGEDPVNPRQHDMQIG